MVPYNGDEAGRQEIDRVDSSPEISPPTPQHELHNEEDVTKIAACKEWI
jgi:hypothetical protein